VLFIFYLFFTLNFKSIETGHHFRMLVDDVIIIRRVAVVSYKLTIIRSLHNLWTKAIFLFADWSEWALLAVDACDPPVAATVDAGCLK